MEALGNKELCYLLRGPFEKPDLVSLEKVARAPHLLSLFPLYLHGTQWEKINQTVFAESLKPMLVVAA